MPRGLDELGIHYGSERSSLDRGYLTRWEPFLTALQHEPIDLLEIGVGAGASLRVWRDWFPNARLTGLDARRVVLDPLIPECRLVQGNQADPGAFQPLLREYRFRVIVDDGSHDPEDQVQTFQLLFPWLAPAAVYVVTGLDDDRSPTECDPDQPGRGPRPQATGAPRQQRSAVPWFANLASDLSHRDIMTHPNPESQVRQRLLRAITGMFFMPGCVIVTS